MDGTSKTYKNKNRSEVGKTFMRHSPSSRRSRGRGGRRHNPKTQSFDSNGPDVRIRGTAFQITEKYQALAKDATATGNTVLAESYLQHAEHYQRVINEIAAKAPTPEIAQPAKTETPVEGNEKVKMEVKPVEADTQKQNTEDKPKRAPRRRAPVKAQVPEMV